MEQVTGSPLSASDILIQLIMKLNKVRKKEELKKSSLKGTWLPPPYIIIEATKWHLYILFPVNFVDLLLGNLYQDSEFVCSAKYWYTVQLKHFNNRDLY